MGAKLIFLGILSSMNDKELQKELDRRNKLRQLETLEANDSRAQAITVGTAGGGTVEPVGSRSRMSHKHSS